MNRHVPGQLVSPMGRLPPVVAAAVVVMAAVLPAGALAGTGNWQGKHAAAQPAAKPVANSGNHSKTVSNTAGSAAPQIRYKSPQGTNSTAVAVSTNSQQRLPPNPAPGPQYRVITPATVGAATGFNVASRTPAAGFRPAVRSFTVGGVTFSGGGVTYNGKPIEPPSVVNSAVNAVKTGNVSIPVSLPSLGNTASFSALGNSAPPLSAGKPIPAFGTLGSAALGTSAPALSAGMPIQAFSTSLPAMPSGKSVSTQLGNAANNLRPNITPINGPNIPPVSAWGKNSGVPPVSAWGKNSGVPPVSDWGKNGGNVGNWFQSGAYGMGGGTSGWTWGGGGGMSSSSGGAPGTFGGQSPGNPGPGQQVPGLGTPDTSTDDNGTDENQTANKPQMVTGSFWMNRPTNSTQQPSATTTKLPAANRHSQGALRPAQSK